MIIYLSNEIDHTDICASASLGNPNTHIRPGSSLESAHGFGKSDNQ